jgi:hypothetical protein
VSFKFLVSRQQSDDSGLAIVLPSPPNLSVCLVFWLNPAQREPVPYFKELFSRRGGRFLHLTFFGSFVLPISTPVVFPSWPLVLTLCRYRPDGCVLIMMLFYAAVCYLIILKPK